MDKDSFFSACLLTMDDNHFLIEWLAYHYHTLPLRHLIVALDPKSRTSPKGIFDRWRNEGMMIDEWGDSDFMPLQLDPNENKTEIKLHNTRQRIFYTKCMKDLHAANRTWTLFLDSDEYLVINQRRRTTRVNVSAPPPPSMKEPGSILRLIQQELSRKNETVLPKKSPCIMIPRLRFGSVESENMLQGAPAGLNASTFQTLRFRKHASLENFTVNKYAKAIFDVSRIKEEDILVMDPHRLVRAHCPEEQLYTKIDDSTMFIIHHYLGTWEQYSFRNDVRKQIKEGNRSRMSYDRHKDVDDGQDDSIRPWLDGFVENKGIELASKLLEGVGDVDFNENVEPEDGRKMLERVVGGNVEQNEHLLEPPEDDASKLLQDVDRVEQNDNVQPDDVFSACLLVMDDNHFLIEWLAYHYHTLPLRHLILAVDPRSVTSPSKILDRWRGHGMIIEEWSDKDFMPQKLLKESLNVSNMENSEVISLHRTRQKQFYSKCMRVLKNAGRTWTLLIDTDEYLVINQRATSRFNVTAPSLEQPASVMSFIRQELAKNETELPKDSPCIMIPRLRFGCAESHLEQVNKDVPSGFNGSAFQTLHCRNHALPKIADINKTGKTIIDVSRIDRKKILVMNPHRPLWHYCPESELYTEIKDNLFVVHHYAGTWEQYSFREDYRNMKSMKVRRHAFSGFEVHMVRFLTSAFGFSPSGNT
jgi:hypothetical protein